ncbi:MAG: DUF6064 family protein [Pseudomonadota bacterium]
MFRSNYAIGDFLLFSERVYDRMFELHNSYVWPLHFVAMAIGLFLLVVAVRPRPRFVRIAFALLTVIWLFVAAVFVYGRYAAINWAAIYLLPLFVAMAAVLLFWAVRSKVPELEQKTGLALLIAVGVLAFSIVGYPLLGLITGKSWSTAEVFGISPDPTVVATLAFVSLVRVSRALLPMLLATVWTAITALTLYALDRSDFFVAPLAAFLCIAAYVIETRQRRSSGTRA